MEQPKKITSIYLILEELPFLADLFFSKLGLNELLEVRNEIVARLTKEDSDFVFKFEREWLWPCKDYEQFCGLCDDYNYGAYPVIMLIHKRLFGDTSGDKYWDCKFKFIRTDAGFRLFKVKWNTVDE